MFDLMPAGSSSSSDGTTSHDIVVLVVKLVIDCSVAVILLITGTQKCTQGNEPVDNKLLVQRELLVVAVNRCAAKRAAALPVN